MNIVQATFPRRNSYLSSTRIQLSTSTTQYSTESVGMVAPELQFRGDTICPGGTRTGTRFSG
jgi:hypothetical protein